MTETTTAKSIDDAVKAGKSDPASLKSGSFVVASLGKNMSGPFAYYPTGSPDADSLKEILGTETVNTDAQIVARWELRDAEWQEITSVTCASLILES